VATSGGSRGVGPERAYAPRLPRTGPAGVVVLSAEESHHLVRVRRVRAGDEVVLFDGVGGSVLGRLVDERAAGAGVEWIAAYPDREPRRAVFVQTSVPGPSRLDDLVASLAELGVTAWGPIVCERSDRKFVDGLERRTERLGRLLIEAAKVSGRSRLMKIAVPREFADAVTRDPSSEGADAGGGAGGGAGGRDGPARSRSGGAAPARRARGSMRAARRGAADRRTRGRLHARRDGASDGGGDRVGIAGRVRAPHRARGRGGRGDRVV